MKLFLDFLPVLLFFVVYRASDIYWATGTLIAATVVQVAATYVRRRRVERLHLITLGAVLVLGGATVILRDKTFIQWKPTVAYWLLAVAFLGSQFIGERPLAQRMLEKAIDCPANVWRRLNGCWVLFFIAVGTLNVYVFKHYSESAWVNFKLFGLLGLTFVFVVAQALYLGRYATDEPAAGESAGIEPDAEG